MKQVFAHIFSDKSDRFSAVLTDLESLGYEVAFDTPMNATIIKEVEDEQGNQTT